MEAFFFLLLAVLFDPIRWLVCVLAAWFVPNYAGALVVGIGVTGVLSVALLPHPSGASLLAGAIASAIIVTVFYFWRRSRRLKVDGTQVSAEAAETP